LAGRILHRVARTVARFPVKRYYDTGVLLKLYTPEGDSDRVRAFVRRAGEPLTFTALHRAECTSALRLKVFRGEAAESEVISALRDIDEDVASGVLHATELEWTAALWRCIGLADAHAGTTGCRTLDTLHVSCAATLGARVMVTSDPRQACLARKAGLKTVNPMA